MYIILEDNSSLRVCLLWSHTLCVGPHKNRIATRSVMINVDALWNDIVDAF